MAKNKCLVLLGYDDELVGDRDKAHLTFATNKIGGNPNWPASAVEIQPCPLCGQTRPMILQIYAPLENSQFHRTLYVFACLNAPCSMQSASWTCLRIQALEKNFGLADGESAAAKVLKESKISWCGGADEWDDDGADDVPHYEGGTYMRVDTSAAAAELANEENGNIIRYEKVSDEDDESNSMDTDPLPGFEKLQVDEKNANGAKGGVALDHPYVVKASAEIEGAEADVIVVETPVSPKHDLLALLKQPQLIPKDVLDVTLRSYYISVHEEVAGATNVSDHVRELLQEYQRHEEVRTSPDNPGNIAAGGGYQPPVPAPDQELYEKGVPMHGDVMFHSFMTKIQENPGQLLRYSRNATPLLIAPLREALPLLCRHCGGEMICEIQILPTIIEKLWLETGNERVPIDFGNVLVWTCQKSCWDTPDKVRAELVLVQAES